MFHRVRDTSKLQIALYNHFWPGRMPSAEHVWEPAYMERNATWRIISASSALLSVHLCPRYDYVDVGVLVFTLRRDPDCVNAGVLFWNGIQMVWTLECWLSLWDGTQMVWTLEFWFSFRNGTEIVWTLECKLIFTLRRDPNWVLVFTLRRDPNSVNVWVFTLRRDPNCVNTGMLVFTLKPDPNFVNVGVCFLPSNRTKPVLFSCCCFVFVFVVVVFVVDYR